MLLQVLITRSVLCIFMTSDHWMHQYYIYTQVQLKHNSVAVEGLPLITAAAVWLSSELPLACHQLCLLICVSCGVMGFLWAAARHLCPVVKAGLAGCVPSQSRVSRHVGWLLSHIWLKVFWQFWAPSLPIKCIIFVVKHKNELFSLTVWTLKSQWLTPLVGTAAKSKDKCNTEQRWEKVTSKFQV